MKVFFMTVLTFLAFNFQERSFSNRTFHQGLTIHRPLPRVRTLQALQITMAEATFTEYRPPRSIASVSEDTATRLAHAHELLGKTYKKSIVRVGEEVTNIKGFIHQQLKTELHGKWAKKISRIQNTIITESKLYSFDPIFLMAVIQTESSFRPEIRGPYGEIGLMQLRPETAKWIAAKYGIKWRGAKSLENPTTNIIIGAAYLDFLRDSFDSHSRLYIAAYNMGSTNVHRALDNQIWPKDYPLKVMQHYIKNYSELNDTLRAAKGSPKDSILVGSLVTPEK